MKGVMIRGREIIIPGCSGMSPLSREATLAARLIHENQPNVNQPMVLAFPNLWIGIDSVGVRFRRRVIGVGG